MKRIVNLMTLFVLITFLSGCNAYNSIDIGDVQDVNFRGMVDNKISLELQIPVTNSNGFKIKLKSMDIDVTINGSYIGKMEIANQIIISAKSNEIQKFPVDIYVKNALSSMAKMYKLRKSGSFEIELNGTIKAKALLKGKTIKVSEKQTVRM